ncbi:hypothetical protein BD414DRAFT_480074 [Trametes punicea]|nr:hypothetical protein BD414DRAFT_480074 [Trametes punicea]
MPALSRAVFLGLHTAALVSLVGPSFAPSSALASPVPVPAPLMPHLADYAAQPPIHNNATMIPQTQTVELGKRTGGVQTQHGKFKSVTLAARDQDTNINILSTVFNDMNGHSSAIRNFASRASTSGGDADFNQQVVSEFIAYKAGLGRFQNILAQLGTDKGLANYDRTDELQTLLKDLINSMKDTLEAITVLVQEIPGLGPILGPLMYDAKCILDYVLDAVENVTDASLNALKPLLQTLIGQVVNAACKCGLQLGTICVAI